MTGRLTTLRCEVDGQHRVEIACVSTHFRLLGSARIVWADTDTPTVGDVFIDPDFRGQGLGRRLVEKALEWAQAHEKPLFLHVALDNSAKVLYEKLGFTYTGEFTPEGAAWMVQLPRQDQLACSAQEEGPASA